MSDENDEIIAAASCLIDVKKNIFWVRPSLKAIKIYSGSSMTVDMMVDFERYDIGLSGELRCNGSFKNFFHMSSEDFEKLINLVGHQFAKKDGNYRESIPVRELLAITLRYLATGESYFRLMHLFKIPTRSISLIVPEVCQALNEVLKDYLKMPKTKKEWISIANDFYRKWNFPHCVGSMDGRNVMFQAPIQPGSEFYNYRGLVNIVLFAIVDANYNFMYIDIGCIKRIIDANSIFRDLLEENKLNIPDDGILSDERQNYVPYVFVGDDAFPLKPNILKPYHGVEEIGLKFKVFNYRLSRVRRVVENAFGVLPAVFGILRKPLLLEPDHAMLSTLACVYLHNYLRKSKSSKWSYSPPGTFDVEDIDAGTVTPGRWRTTGGGFTSLLPLIKTPRKASLPAHLIRNDIGDFLSYTLV